ncbi:TIGR03085 family metal-binding protein [Nocardioides luteus]|uniref:TIGR03085 family protein n=1 Tax=Nocardioides luteus TaxID=1844 RepID=A0A1J4N334_9ACTN|nr:TIGR03085 family metal-binding protein [Nocardioides luteus]OIJ25972.1 TIGR03085 family protein [Nocardioides luteus]
MPSFARAERIALCDTAVSLGPAAPTLCEGWQVKDLLVHLLVRERRPWAAAGIVLPPLAPVLRKAEAAYAVQPLEALAARLRDPKGTPFALGPIEKAVNTVEFFVHHEDLRRAQPSWEPRTLPAAAERDLWRTLKLLGKGLVRSAGTPVVVSNGTDTSTLRAGEEPVTVTGPVGELLLFCFGRHQVRGLTFDGPAERITQLENASLGF